MKILLVDDHKMMRDGLRAILEQARLNVVGEASSGREALASAQRVQPGVVIMDISMPELNGIDATRRLLEEMPRVKVIGLSMNADRRYVMAMFKAGAVGYLLKNAAAEELILAIRAVADDLSYVSPSIASVFVQEAVERSRPSPREAKRALSPREREVLQLLAEGRSSKEIAGGLSVGITTVDTYRRQVMDKLGLRTVAELTKYAIREGLTTLE